MSDMFLDENKPIHTCKKGSCSGCPTAKSISCHFNLKQLLHFYLIALTPFILGGYGIFQFNWIFLVVWIGIIIGFFNFIEIRVMCSHCPHYAEPGMKSLKCWANYGSPKLWKYRPGPMSIIEKIVFITGLIMVFSIPVVFFVILQYWFLLIIYTMTVGVFFTTLRAHLCSKCMNFACSLNNVKDEDRNEFFKNNPIVAKAWKKNKGEIKR